MSSPPSLHPDFRHETVRIGASQQSVLIVDDFVAQPDALVEAAAAAHFSTVARGYYPGLRARAPGDYAQTLFDHLGQLIFDTFGAGGAGLEFVECNYSLVTTPPQDLVRLQRVPHYDSSSIHQLAVLHYLCVESHGGTAFFRHKRTGAEVIDPALSAQYHAMVERDVAEHGEPASGYLQTAEPAYEQIAAFKARFNRLLVYRSANLHSALIPPGHDLSADPRRGRLTINAFVRVIPAQPTAA